MPRAPWTVRDFAVFAGLEPRNARYFLQRIDAKHAGAILTRARRGYLVDRDALRRLEPDLFEDVTCPAWRLDDVAEGIAELAADVRRAAAQADHNSRAITRLPRWS